MRRWALALVVIALGAGAAVAIANVPSNPRAGRAVALRIFSKLRLPPGARRSPDDPSGSKLAKPGTYPATPNLVDLHRYWRVPGSLRTVFDWIQSHPPAGAVGEEGGAMGRDGRIVSEYVGYWFLRPRLGGAPAETLLVTGAPARGSGTALRVDAQVVWLLKRPASEQIPRGVRGIWFEARGGGQVDGGSVFNRHRIRRVTALIDSLPAAQPGAFSCPGSPGQSMRLVFLDGARHRLSTAYVDGGGCEIVNLWIHGRRQHALQGNPKLIRSLSSALGISL